MFREEYPGWEYNLEVVSDRETKKQRRQVSKTKKDDIFKCCRGTEKNSAYLSPQFQTGSELKPGTMADKNEVGWVMQLWTWKPLRVCIRRQTPHSSTTHLTDNYYPLLQETNEAIKRHTESPTSLKLRAWISKTALNQGSFDIWIRHTGCKNTHTTVYNHRKEPKIFRGRQ